MSVNLSRKTKSHYRFIDIIKFFCSFLIIGIHTNPFGFSSILDNAFGMLTRIAVPFFFVSSAFFLFKNEFSWKRVMGYCKRMMLLYAVYSVIYVIYDLVTGQVIWSTFFIKLFVSGYQHLWFLQQSVIAVLVIALITQVFKKPKLLYILAAALYFIGVMMFTYYPLTEWIEPVEWLHKGIISEIVFERSWFFYAVPYMAIGYYFSKNPMPRIKHSIIGVAVSYSLLALECVIGIFAVHAPSTVLWFSVLPLSFFIFSLVAQIEFNVECNVLALRKSSTLIYCIHLLIVFILQSLGLNYILLFIVTSVLSLLYSFVVIKLSSLRYLRFLKILY